MADGVAQVHREILAGTTALRGCCWSHHTHRHDGAPPMIAWKDWVLACKGDEASGISSVQLHDGQQFREGFVDIESGARRGGLRLFYFFDGCGCRHIRYLTTRD
jgi:hypothetical protein